MMFRSKELRANIYGLTDAWRDGGYSEDFITLSMARYHNRTLAVPKAAIFPNELGEIEFWKFWNFACRQIFVLTNTYATGAQRFIAIGAQGINVTTHAFIFVGSVLAVLIAVLVAIALPIRLIAGGPLAADAGPYAALGMHGTCARNGALPAAFAFWPFLMLCSYGFKRMLYSFARLCNVLSPHGYDNQPIDVSHISTLNIAIAYLGYCPLIPAATIATLCTNAIVWANVNFVVTNGRVSKMERRDGKGGVPEGQWYSVPREVSLEKTLKEMSEYRMKLEGFRAPR